MPMVPKIAAVALAVAVLAGCQRPRETEDERIRRQAAEDTRQVKQDAKQFVADTKKEALHAQRQIKDVVAGVKQGLADPGARAGSAPSASVDINHASAAELQALPGVSPMVARRILAGRPYASPDEVVTKAHVRQAEYDRIADLIVAR